MNYKENIKMKYEELNSIYKTHIPLEILKVLEEHGYK